MLALFARVHLVDGGAAAVIDGFQDTHGLFDLCLAEVQLCLFQLGRVETIVDVQIAEAEVVDCSLGSVDVHDHASRSASISMLDSSNDVSSACEFTTEMRVVCTGARHTVGEDNYREPIVAHFRLARSMLCELETGCNLSQRYINVRRDCDAASQTPESDSENAVGKEVADVSELCVALCCYRERLRHPEMFWLVRLCSLDGGVVYREKDCFQLQKWSVGAICGLYMTRTRNAGCPFDLNLTSLVLRPSQGLSISIVPTEWGPV